MSCNEWKEYRLEDISQIIFSGGTPSTRNEEFWDGDIPWLSSGETRNSFINKTEKTITEEGVKNSSTKLALNGDIVIASAGQGFTRGQVSFCNIDTYINQSLIAIRANNILLNNKYLYYNLKSRYNELRQISDSHSIRGSLTTKMIKDLIIKLPSLEEQEKIANILSSLDDKIELNNEMNKTLEEMAQSIFKRWFVDFEFPNEDGEPYKSSGGEMVDSELGMIPKGWEVKEFGDIVDFKYGKMPKKSDIVDTGFPIFSGYKITGYYKECMFEESQLIVVARGVGGTGDVKFSPPKCFLTNLSIAILLRDNNIIKEYLYYYLKNSNLKLLDTGSAQSQITITNLSKFKIINPTNDIMKKFHIFVSRLLKMKDSLEIENKSLIETRDTLLPKLMSGEIRVK